MDSRDELLEAVTPVVRALEDLVVAYLVGGSVASAAHGEFRATNDVDLVTELQEEHVDAFVSAIGAGYYADAGAIRTAVRRRATFNLIHLDTMLKVDVFVSRCRPYDAEAMRRRVLQQYGDIEAPSTLHLASPEDVVLAKLAWFRSGGGVSERQWRDVLGVLRVQGAKVDVAYLRRWSAELDVGDLLERALQQSGL
jgi:hypothetical protein